MSQKLINEKEGFQDHVIINLHPKQSLLLLTFSQIVNDPPCCCKQAKAGCNPISTHHHLSSCVAYQIYSSSPSYQSINSVVRKSQVPAMSALLELRQKQGETTFFVELKSWENFASNFWTTLSHFLSVFVGSEENYPD